MDVNTLRAIVTVVSLLTFVGIAAWAYAGRNRRRFDDAAVIPFQQD